MGNERSEGRGCTWIEAIFGATPCLRRGVLRCSVLLWFPFFFYISLHDDTQTFVASPPIDEDGNGDFFQFLSLVDHEGMNIS